MQEVILSVINKLGYWGVLLLIFAENLFPPIPSEVILTFSGFVTTITSLKPWIMVVFATLGSLFGAYILYAMGRWLSPQRMSKMLGSSLTKKLGFEAQDIEKAKTKFLKSGALSVLLCRCVPIVRSLISIPAGMAHMPIIKFTVYTTIGSAVWNTLLIYIGALAGEHRTAIIQYFSAFQHSAKLIIIIIVIICIIYLWRKKHAKKT